MELEIVLSNSFITLLVLLRLSWETIFKFSGQKTKFSFPGKKTQENSKHGHFII